MTLDTAKLPLGKKPFVPDHRDLLLGSYVDKQKIIDSAAVPAALDWTRWRISPYDTDPLGNNVLGDCVFAAYAHKLRRIGLITGNPALANITAEMVKAAYLKATEGVDEGFVIRDMLKIAKSETGLLGVRIDAFAAINHRDPVERLVACWLGCGTLNGYALPLASQDQTDPQGRQLWYRPAGGWPEGRGPGTWGGHCEDNHAEGPMLGTDNSWGQRTVRTEEWITDCCEECWIFLCKEWAPAGRAPNGFDYQQLLSDARARGEG
jgi:hypothetical protein